MSRSDRDRLLDVLEAGTAIAEHLQRGPLSDGLVFDAVRARFIEIGEAVKDVSTELHSQPPSIPSRQVAAMRNQLAHRYFDTSRAIVADTVGPELAELLAATRVLLAALDPSSRAHPRRSFEGRPSTDASLAGS